MKCAPKSRLALLASVGGCVLLLQGCASVAVRVERPERILARELRQPATAGGDASRLATAVAGAGDGQEGILVEAARAALPGAMTGDPDMRRVYAAAIGKLVRVMEQDAFAPLTFTEGRTRRLVVRKQGALDPSLATQLLPAPSVRIGRLAPRSTTNGIGLPYVMYYERDAAFLKAQPGVPPTGMAMPATAVLSFRGTAATLEFVPTRDRTSLRLDGKTVPLAADFSAPLAVLVSKGKNRALDLMSMIFTASRINQSGLFQFEPYDPDRIPVVFVHGLMSRPEAWVQAVNRLLEEPDIRERYQFWFFIYPTGLPVWASAARLREELERFDSEIVRSTGRRHPHPKVLVGHSMGGLVSSLMIRDGGDKLWGQFSERPLSEAVAKPAFGEVLRRYVDFRARDDVSRVIFAATPHRGSPFALRPISSFAAALIRLPNTLDRSGRRILIDLLSEDVRSAFAAPANSIRFLRANSPLLLSILDLPRDETIPLHSIIGNRGRPGPIEKSSDGIVPYWSAHLDEVVSEKVVPSGHGVNEHPEGTDEIARILQQHLRTR